MHLLRRRRLQRPRGHRKIVHRNDGAGAGRPRWAYVVLGASIILETYSLTVAIGVPPHRAGRGCGARSRSARSHGADGAVRGSGGALRAWWRSPASTLTRADRQSAWDGAGVRSSSAWRSARWRRCWRGTPRDCSSAQASARRRGVDPRHRHRHRRRASSSCTCARCTSARRSDRGDQGALPRNLDTARSSAHQRDRGAAAGRRCRACAASTSSPGSTRVGANAIGRREEGRGQWPRACPSGGSRSCR